MKKQLLFDFRMAAFAVLTLLTAQSSFAQNWTGATSTDFLVSTNWATVPTVTYNSTTNTYAYGASLNFSTATAGVVNTTCVLNNTIDPAANYTVPTFFVGFGTTFTIHNNITSVTATSSSDGTLNINAGTHRIHKLYVGNTTAVGATGGVVNVEAGAVLNGTNVWRLGVTTPGTSYINVKGGTLTNAGSGSSLTIGGAAGKNGVLAITNSGIVQLSAGLGLTATGTINVAGGSLDFSSVNLSNDGTINVTNGLFKLSNAAATINNSTTAATTAATGVININGATASLEASGALAIGNSFAGSTGLVTVNVNSGTMNVGGALTISAPSGIYTGLINIDEGSIVLTGNQTAGIAALVAAGRIKTSGTALAELKIISNTYDAGTNKTTVAAVAAASNTAPVAVGDAIVVAPGGTATALVGGAVTSVLTNDTDAESNPLTAIVVTNPTYGTLTLNSNGTFSYVQNIGSSATDSFTYKANDGTSDSTPATVTITISSVNNAPVANNDAFSVKQGGIATVLTGGATSVVTNDTDTEGNPLTVTVVTGPANGTLTLNANGTFSYLHNNSATTTDSFTYKANDGTSDSNEATVNITVTAPVATTNTWTGGTSTDFLVASNWAASDAPNPAVFSTLASFTVSTGTTNSPVLNANYSTVLGAANCAVLNLNAGAVLTTNADITTNTSSSLVAGTLNVNAGTFTSRLYVQSGGIVNVASGATLTEAGVNRLGVSGAGTLNIDGGTLNCTGLGTAGLSIGAAGVLNLNSGTVNYTAATALGISVGGLINIDAGSIVLTGDQTAGIAALVTAGKITLSGAALAAGKIISNTYDAGTDKTTVVAVAAPLGVNDVKLDANAILVYSQNQGIKIQSGNLILSDVNVYDVKGSLVASKKSIGSNETIIALNAQNQVYVVKVTTAEGNVVTKKIIQ